MSCAIVGSGLAALAAYATLRHGGLAAGEIAVFGTDDDPTAAWRVRAAAIRQRRMRSESDGHLAPASFPGLAVRAALRGRGIQPLLETVANRYHPTVDEFLDHADEVRERSRWDDSFHAHRVERIDLPRDHPADLQVKAVRAEVYRSQRVLSCHADTVARLSHFRRRRHDLRE